MSRRTLRRMYAFTIVNVAGTACGLCTGMLRFGPWLRHCG